MNTRFVGLAGLAFVFAACNSMDADNKTSARIQLALNRQKWSAAAIHDYSFDYDLDAMILSHPLHIEVLADTVNRVTDRQTGAVYSNAGIQTVDSLFTRIAALLSSPDVNPTIEYNQLAGYPSRINTLTNIPDMGYVIIISNFQRSN